MRRHLRVALAAAALVTPLLIVSGAGPASAAGPSLKVDAIGRNGAAAAHSQVEVVDAGTGRRAAVGAGGRTLSLPAGKYVVLALIGDDRDQDNTLGAAVVTVSGATTTTIDARKGKPLDVSLDTADAGGQRLSDVICAGRESLSDSGLGPDSPQQLYVIPNTSTLLRFGYVSVWDSGSPVNGFLATGGTVGLPARPGGAFHSAAMATVHVQSGEGPNAGNARDLNFVPSGSPCQAQLQTNVRANVEGAYSYTAGVVAGKWDVQSMDYSDAIGTLGYYDGVHDYAAGKSYQQTFYRPAWGPAHTTPYIETGELRFDTDHMFDDPTVTGGEHSAKVSSTLSRDGAVIARQTGAGTTYPPPMFEARVANPGWYNLDAYAVRYNPGVTFPAGMLSPSSRVVYHFWADPRVQQSAPGFLTRFLTTGLDERGHARTRSTTPVGLFMDRTDSTPGLGIPFHGDTVKTVQAWYSTDNAKTWHGLPVTHTGSTWQTAVPNPASGKVSLSAKVTDTAGNSTQTYVNQAYAVG
ncbi:hypothetical protein [Streptomyces sp. CA-111067]|uniref:hypothetical protein n=1 Tax=Streptomyces sp. CA-111067 TaxID=3240046 RepID=UPI003D95B81E